VLKHRIISGCLIGVALVLAVNYVPLLGVWLLLVSISALAQLEFHALLDRAGIPAFRIVGLICGACLISATFFTIGPQPTEISRAYQWENSVLLASLIAVFVRQFPQKHNDKPLATIGCTLLAIWYVPYLFNFFTRLALSWDGSRAGSFVSETGRLLVLYLVVVVKCTDIGAYFAGRWFGRHKLFPRISPAKTWEGLFGGIAAAILASWLFFFFTNGRFGKVTLSAGHAIALGWLLSVVGVVGDMFESLLKRAAGAKDSGSVVPGMGGILDVLDSLLFGAPILYVYCRLFLS
jgi:phosphatidate cytidylyltransferase